MNPRGAMLKPPHPRSTVIQGRRKRDDNLDRMSEITYLGVFEPADDGGFSAYFPDLPGCTSYGATLNEAKRNAKDALALHLYGLKKDGELVPAPSVTPEVDPETAPGYLVYPVTVMLSLVCDEPI